MVCSLAGEDIANKTVIITGAMVSLLLMLFGVFALRNGVLNPFLLCAGAVLSFCVVKNKPAL